MAMIASYTMNAKIGCDGHLRRGVRRNLYPKTKTAVQIESMSERNNLPFPLAKLRDAVQQESDGRRHHAAFMCWEMSLKLLAISLLSDYRKNPVGCANLVDPIRSLSRPSLGHFRSLISVLNPLLQNESPAHHRVADTLRYKNREDLPATSAFQHALVKRIFQNRESNTDHQRCNIGELLDQLLTYRSRMYGAHGGLGSLEDQLHVADLMMGSFDELVGQGEDAVLDIMVGGQLEGHSSGQTYPLMGNRCDADSLPNDLEIGLTKGAQTVSLAPFIAFDPDSDEVCFLNGLAGNHGRSMRYLSYMANRQMELPSGPFCRDVLTMISKAGESNEGEFASGTLSVDMPMRDEAFPPDKLGEYKLMERIGRGGAGMVYRAYQPSLRRYVALKRLISHYNQDSLRRFDREIQALKQLNHSSLPAFYGTATSGDEWFYTMELVEGADLSLVLEGLRSADQEIDVHEFCESIGRAYIRRFDSQSLAVGASEDQGTSHPKVSQFSITKEYTARAVELIHQVSMAADTLHQARVPVVHRDIKPANIVVTRDATRAVLVDLGLVKAADDIGELTRAGQQVGTVRYASPEQLAGLRVDARSDVYSLGATLYELLTLQPLFPHLNSADEVAFAVQHQSPVSPNELNSHADSGLSAIVMKCLEKQPKHRYESAQQFANDLKRWERNEPLQAKPVGQAVKAFRYAINKRRQVLTFVIIALLIVVSILATVFWIQGDLTGEKRRRLQQEKQQQIDSQLAVKAALSLPIDEFDAKLQTIAPMSSAEIAIYEEIAQSSALSIDLDQRVKVHLALLDHDDSYATELCSDIVDMDAKSFDIVKHRIVPYSYAWESQLWGILEGDLNVSEEGKFRALRLLTHSATKTNNERKRRLLSHLQLTVNQLLIRYANAEPSLPAISDLSLLHPEIEKELEVLFRSSDESQQKSITGIVVDMHRHDLGKLAADFLAVEGTPVEGIVISRFARSVQTHRSPYLVSGLMSLAESYSWGGQRTPITSVTSNPVNMPPKDFHDYLLAASDHSPLGSPAKGNLSKSAMALLIGWKIMPTNYFYDQISKSSERATVLMRLPKESREQFSEWSTSADRLEETKTPSNE